jgi:curli biogenesis system outer membrane secretion channel CsgG
MGSPTGTRPRGASKSPHTFLEVIVKTRPCLTTCGLILAGLLLACGCSSTKESASKDKLTADVGKYAPPPRELGDNRPRVGVPPFKCTISPGSFSGSNSQLAQVAADQMTTLLSRSGRFDVIERAQVEQLIDEQNMEGIVRGDEMAKAGQVHGVDYLLVGKVTNFRVKQDNTKSGVDVGGIGGMIGGGKFGAGSTGFDQKNQRITTECGVDIRLVEPSSGRVVVSHFGEFKRTDSAGALGISVFGMGGHSDAGLTIEADDAGKILRLAFDDALKKMMPEIDQKILARQGKRPEQNEGRTRTTAAPAREADEDASSGADAAAPDEPPQKPARSGGTPSNSAAPTAGKKFCPECGEALVAGAKFCPKCGAKVQ